jgi:DNA primase
MIAAKRPLIEFALERSIAKFDLASREGQVAAVRAASVIVAEIADPTLRSSYEKHLSELTLVDRAAVNQMVSEAAKGVRRAAVAPDAEQGRSSLSEVAGEVLPQVNLSDPINRNERFLLDVVAQIPNVIDATTMKRIFRSFFSAPRHAAIARVIESHYGSADFTSAVSNALPGDLASLWREMILTPLPIMAGGDPIPYASGVIKSSLISTIEFEKQVLIQGLTQARASKNEELSDQIAKKLIELDSELIKLRAKR